MATKDVTDLMVCLAYEEIQRQRGPKFEHEYVMPYDFLHEMTGQCVKVCYRAMERACDRGYIEYGVSLRTGWLTDKGWELLGRKQ